jgi:aldehyde:ferredoxin oxidoreductase
MNGETLWGMGNQETTKHLNLTFREAALTIGQAGENLVPMANIKSGHRFAGRGGLGAVMGSKNVKAVIARGFSHQYVPKNPKLFSKAVKNLKRYIHRSDFVNQYRLYGTNANVKYGIKSGFSPVRNFQNRFDRRTELTSGETIAEKYKIRSSSCKHCSINCGHKGHFKDGKLHQMPEYETTGMFGSNIENFDTDRIIEWNDQLNDYGLDSISVGGTLAWAMEAAEKGIRESELEFGKTDNIAQIIEDIALVRNEGTELSKGSRWLSKKYGGGEFAIQSKGLEIAAYDPRAGWGHGLGYAVGNKGGDHLTSYLIGIEAIFPYINPHTTRGKAKWTIFFEDLFTAMNSLQICQFTAYGFLVEYPIPKYVPLPILRPIITWFPGLSQYLMNWNGLNQLFSGITGLHLSQKGFIKAGERINQLERQINEEMNPGGLDDTIPQRFLEEKITKFAGDQEVIPIEKLVREYNRLRKRG